MTNLQGDSNIARRWQWLLNEARERVAVDVLDADFVDAYIQRFKPQYRPTWWGANKCPQIGRDLASMAQAGLLSRSRVGLGSNWQPGFPRWVFSYKPGPGR